MAIKFQILKHPKKIKKFLGAIKDAADSERNALGFNAVGVYKENIKVGKIWVAVDSKEIYLGHIMFGGSPPHLLKIFQIYVTKQSRGSGVAATFVKEIIKYGEQLSCLNLRADMASDLSSAIKFWQSQGFCAVAARKKPNTSGREIHIFKKRLSTPSLFPKESLPLKIADSSIGSVKDSYIIDLNIFLTLVKNQNDEEIVSEIIKAALAGEFSIFVTPEFKEELERTKFDNDPFLDLAEKALPVLEKIDNDELIKIQEEIRKIIFPNRSKTRKGAIQDTSDLRHLAYCVQNFKTGFITQEEALLRSKEIIQEKYNLTLYSPQDFSIDHLRNNDISPIAIPFSTQEGSIQISSNTNPTETKSFLKELDSELNEVSNLLAKSSTRGFKENQLVFLNQEMCALYTAETRGSKHNILEGFFVTKNKIFKNLDYVFEHVLECFMRLAQTTKANQLTFYVRQEDFDLENTCLARGFQRSNSNIKGMVRLIKIPCPILVKKSNWKEFRKDFYEKTQINFPQLIPNIRKSQSGDLCIQAAKEEEGYELEIFKLETMLSPSLILLPKRQGAIIPINPTFASDLLSRSDGLLPFPITEEALLRVEKVYFRKPTHTKTFITGMPIVFYESGKGRGAIGCGRVTSTNVCNIKNAIKIYRRYGVLSERNLAGFADNNGKVQVITFDNFKEFKRPIPMKKLKEFGCAKANLVGPEKLSYNQLFNILHEGMEFPSQDILLSINPNYVAKILNGKKTIELRKKSFSANGGIRVWIYSTSPVSSIVACAFVSEVHKDTPANIWTRFNNKCGISKSEFDAYFSNSKEAFALTLKWAEKLKTRIPLQGIKNMSEGFNPPQYYRYIDHESDLFDFLISQQI